MVQSRTGRALENERKYPNIVELVVSDGALEIELSRRIMEFHKSRHIQPRHARWVTKDNHTYCRWCFADLGTACDFIEQFGGAFYKPSVEQVARSR